MAATDENSRIVVPFKPSLSYMCLAKIAIGLHNFSYKILKKAFPEIRVIKLPELKEYSPEDFSLLSNRAKERFGLIPTRLRKSALKVLDQILSEVGEWLQRHEKKAGCLYYYGKCDFFWRSEGSIDRIKTAQEIVHNQNVAVGPRFEIACMYCLEKSVQTLWSVLVANGETDWFERPYDKSRCNAMVRFWVRWIREGAQFHWTQAAHEYLDFSMFLIYQHGSAPSFNTLFRTLIPEVRCEFFKYMGLCDNDDFRFSLYTVTNKEQEKIMSNTAFARYVLLIHTDVPLASLFLDIAEKSWKFLDHSSFHLVLLYILELKDNIDFDYYAYLAMEFWNRSPGHFKEHRGGPVICVCDQMLKFIEEMKGKESLLYNGEARLKSVLTT